MPLLVTGTIGIDTVHTPSAKAERVLGGSCTYFAAAASFHAPVRIVAAVGGDWPEEHRKTLDGFANICLDGLDERPESSTFAWGGRYHENMNSRETLFTDLGVLEEDPPAIPDSYTDSEYIFLANTHPAVQMQLLSHFPKRKLAVADSMDLWINIAHDELMALLKTDRRAGDQRLGGRAAYGDQQRDHRGTSRFSRWVRPSWSSRRASTARCWCIGMAWPPLPAYPAERHQVIDPTGAGDSLRRRA